MIATANSSAGLTGTLWGSGDWANGTDVAGDGDVTTGTVNVYGQPAFVNPGAGDYHITGDSAAVHAGMQAGVATDIDRETRDGAPDIGADEYISALSTATPTATPTLTATPTSTATATPTFTAIPSFPLFLPLLLK